MLAPRKQRRKVMRRYSSIFVAVIALFVMPAVFAESKPRIGVAEFKNDTSAGWWYGGAGTDLSSMLTNELAGTEKFRVVERSKLEHVLNEQDLGASGRVSKSSAAKIGRLTGAQYLVMGTVSAYSENASGGGGGIGFRGIHLGGKKQDAYMAIDLRVVDTETGEVAFTRTVEARASSYGISGSGYTHGLSGGLGKYENTPTGKAIRACLMEISDYLGCVMVDKDQCVAEYKAKESKRREGTKKSIKLD
jgi:curli biogenesis system outer membrane secretion channel CsgG